MSLKLERTNWSGLAAGEKEALLRRPVARQTGLQEAVAGIITRVREGGDAALRSLTLELDGVEPAHFEVPADEIEQAADRVSPELTAALEDAASRIRAFHRADQPRNGSVETSPGLTCSVQYQPLSPVGLYIPGGSAPLVSTVLMLAIPAEIAG